MINNHHKEDIAKELSTKTGFSMIYSKKLINDLIDSIIVNVNYKELNFKNFGTLKTICKSERIGRNPKTKEKYIINSRKTLKFVASRNLNKDLNII